MKTEEIKALTANVQKVIIGKDETIKLLLVGLLTNGHILIEDVPGLGKTMLSLALAKSIGGDFKRIQFTPDLLPTDVTGGYIFDPKVSEFSFRKGPVFTNILLADEINRTTPRTQSALLECMQEFKVTQDGKTFALPLPFMVIGTQNPIEHQGTYPLPEAQVDRFLMRVSIGYLTPEQEVLVVSGQKAAHPIETLKPVTELQAVLAMQEEVKKVNFSPQLLEYVIKLVHQTRKREEIKLGASPRASIALMKASSAWAYLEGRDYVTPDDISKMLPWVLKHRLQLHPKAVVAGKTPEMIIGEIVYSIPVP
jgi:MoxR-like ATPase